jgi:membrane protease YdiL (CAAX protease family)
MRVDRQDVLRTKLGAGRVAFSLAFHLGAIGGVRTVGLLLAALVASLVVDRAVLDSHVAVGLGLTACLVVIARAYGLTAADLGLARSTWPAGLRWGAAAAALVGAVYALAYLVPPVRQVLPDGQGDLGRAALWAVLVVIPLGTVLPEELAFRGLLLALLERRYGVVAATVASSGLFGLWHVLASLGGGAANAAMVEVVGGDAVGTVVRVAVTVGFTSAAGVVLCWLRLRSDSLIAPVLAHWTVNGLGVIVAALV